MGGSEGFGKAVFFFGAVILVGTNSCCSCSCFLVLVLVLVLVVVGGGGGTTSFSTMKAEKPWLRPEKEAALRCSGVDSEEGAGRLAEFIGLSLLCFLGCFFKSLECKKGKGPLFWEHV